MFRYCKFVFVVLTFIWHQAFRVLTANSKIGVCLYSRYCRIVAQEYERSQLTELAKHIILYSKGHYQRTDSRVEDLKTLTAKYVGIDKEYLTTEALFLVVGDTFLESCSKSDVKKFLSYFSHEPRFPWCGPTRGPNMLEDLISEMLGLMACIRVYNGNKKLIDLGKPNYDYLPEPRIGPIPVRGRR